MNDIYSSFFYNKNYLEDNEGLSFRKNEHDATLELNGRSITMTVFEMKELIIDLLDMLEDTLPLGTVVDIRKDLFSDRKEIQELEYIRIIITYRFMGDDDKYYLPYAGVVYPTGMLGSNDVYFFTRAMIDKVISRGYSDEDEENYVYAAKKALIIEEEMNSIGYAIPEEAKELF